MPRRVLEFFVGGEPESQGTARVVAPPGRRPFAYRKQKPWEKHFSLACDEQRQSPPWDGPCLLLAEFIMPRPQGLPKTKPVCHSVRPDCSNMLKCLEDALKGRIVRDDARFVAALPIKRYARPTEGPGVRIRLMEIPDARTVSVYYDGILFGEVNLSSLDGEAPLLKPARPTSAPSLPLTGGVNAPGTAAPARASAAPEPGGGDGLPGGNAA